MQETSPVKIIKSILPIAQSAVREYVADKTGVFHVDYTGSAIKGSTFVTYVSNVGLPIDLDPELEISDADFKELLANWMSSMNMANIPALAKAASIVMSAVYQVEGFEEDKLPPSIVEFIGENKDIVVNWTLFMDFIISFAFFKAAGVEGEYFQDYYARSTDLKDVNIGVIDDAEAVGKNFVYLFRIPGFTMSLLENWTFPEDLVIFQQQLNPLFYGGKSILTWFDSNENEAARIMALLSRSPDAFDEVMKIEE